MKWGEYYLWPANFQFLICDPAVVCRQVAGESRPELLPDFGCEFAVVSAVDSAREDPDSCGIELGKVAVVGKKGGAVASETLMNSRRSKSVKLVSTRAKPLEVEIAEEDERMSSSADNMVYCCIAKGKKVIYCYNSKDGDPQMESTAALCLENAPSYHWHYIHTSGSRSYSYLMADGHTFFAIIDPSVGNVGALQFLERVRDVFRNTNRNGFHDSLVPAVQRLVASLEKMPRAAFILEESVERGGSSDSPSCTSSKVPLLGKNGSRKDKKAKDKAVSAGDGEDEQHGTRVRIDVPIEEVGGISLERSTSQSRLRRQQSSQSLWMRHVKIIIIVDAIVCLVLFGAWLAVCKGFQCVSG